jgi:xanthine dehydrogenase YagR molybdenum-binding subunit
VLDPRTGHVINHDLAEYHIATCADVIGPDGAGIEARWIDAHDPHVNPMGS